MRFFSQVSKLIRSTYNTTNRFLIPRSFGSLVKATYSWHYANKQYNGLWVIAKLQKAFDIFKSVFIFLGSLFSGNDDINRYKLNQKFEEIRRKNSSNLNQSNKPICAYFVSKQDDNGAVITGDVLKYYHLHKILNLSEHYIVHPYVINTSADIQRHMTTLENVSLINIVAHGDRDMVCIDDSMTLTDTPFANLANNAEIILDACSVAAGTNSYAHKIASANRNRNVTVFGPSNYLFFSKPVIEVKEDGPHVSGVDHGFCIITPYKMCSFRIT